MHNIASKASILCLAIWTLISGPAFKLKLKKLLDMIVIDIFSNELKCVQQLTHAVVLSNIFYFSTT